MTGVVFFPFESTIVAPPPWWGVPVIAGSFLILGAVLGFLFNRANDKRKAKLEAAVRWHELVRTLSAAVFAHAAQIKELARENAELYDEGFDDSVSFKARVSRALWNEQIMLREKASEISIIVPPPFTKALSEYVFLVSSSIDEDKEAASDALRRLPGARWLLMGEVRRYLGLPKDSTS